MNERVIAISSIPDTATQQTLKNLRVFCSSEMEFQMGQQEASIMAYGRIFFAQLAQLSPEAGLGDVSQIELGGWRVQKNSCEKLSAENHPQFGMIRVQ
ncbi:MAG: hypothetical protein ABI758_01785 [Candidatus Woesebacteria bacterium]